jgi:pyruvate/2-oxoglutarate dehydrogenase complex dihydrolipoamide acyltransferase (E2) component
MNRRARSGRPVTGWRRLAGASWRAPSDPQFFGSLDVDAAALLAFIDDVRKHTAARLTMTHLVGRAVAHGLASVPAMRQRLARGREYDRESVDVFFIVTTDDGKELTGVKIEHADTKSATEISDELAQRRASIAAGTDEQFGRTKRMLEVLPRPILRAGILLSAWLTSDLNVNLPKYGLPRQAFGGAMITSVGMWDVSTAYSPLASYYRVPVLVLVGSVQPRPVAQAGSVQVRPMMTLTATFDHRYVDGYQASKFAAALREYCAHPAAFEPAVPHS